MEKIAIVGCGLVGRAWSMVFARAGHQVKLYDAGPGVVDKAVGLIREGLEELHKAGLVAESPETILKRISTTQILADAVGDADYVQESTAEKVDVKREVFALLDAAAPAGCILASST